jgi:RNA polymerase sigma-70 factor (ECF subfamily)
VASPATEGGYAPARDGGLSTAEVGGFGTPEVGGDFARLTDPLRPELLAYCYRMLGSVHDAEDQVQETMLRAWRAYGRFEGRASLRSWLYRIATNACLRALENRARRPLPTGLGGPSGDPAEPLEPEQHEVPWLEPFPDVLLGAEFADPAAIAAARHGMRLALIAALQYLPGRQRAVLILRDVLKWRAAEVAELLGVSTAAVNSALQRARAGLREAAPVQDELHEPSDAEQRALLDRYAAAFENADVAALTGLLRSDAVLEMPPTPTWFCGRDSIVRFLDGHVLRGPGDLRTVPLSANGQPALAAYDRGADGRYRAYVITVLTCAPSGVARITAFRDLRLFPYFRLPAELLAPAHSSGL